MGCRCCTRTRASCCLKGDDVWYGDTRVDIVYRDASVLDLTDHGEGRRGCRADAGAAQQNRVVSSISAELDQKSCFEVLTDPELADQFLTVEERQVMRRHVLWTRVVSERRTVSPTGKRSICSSTRGRSASRSCSSRIGRTAARACSSGRRRHRASGSGDRRECWPIRAGGWCSRSRRFPSEVVSRARRTAELHVEPFYVVMGFAPSRYGVGARGARVAGDGGERGAAGRHVRGDGERQGVGRLGVRCQVSGARCQVGFVCS